MARRSLFRVAALALLLVGCGNQDVRSADAPRPAQAPPATPPAALREFCGGEAGPGEIEAYFTRLAAHLEAGVEPVPMEFYGEHFSVRSPTNRYLVFRRADMRAGARALPSLEDWREISRQGPEALQSAGYRGCFLAYGKVWFEADGQGSFAMSAFNKTMPWDAPSP